MKKLSKIAQVTFFAAAFAVLFSGTADAYIDPSVMNYAIQAVAGVVIAVGAAAGIYWRKAKKKIDKSLGIDEDGFNAAMKRQKEQARAARKTTNYMGADVTVYQSIDPAITTEFIGYDRLTAESEISVLTTEDEIVEALTDGQTGTIITKETPFYGTMGGQEGDFGQITAPDGSVFEVKDTIHLQGGKIGHVGVVVKGMFEVGEKVTMSVDKENRELTSRNHSATHLLHKALRTVLGSHVEQAGSLVTRDRLRFDLGVMGAVRKSNNLVDTQKTFYSAAAFNPTFPAHKNETGGWDQVTTASWITNPLAWMEVSDEESNAHFNAHLKMELVLTPHLVFSAFGSYLYNVIDNGQYLPTTVWAHGQAYRGEQKVEDVLGNVMLNFNRAFGKHKLDALLLGEAQQRVMSGFHTTVTNFTTDKFGFHNLQAGAVRLWEGTGSYYENPRLASFLGRVNYVYDDRYVATVNMRTDASSKVGRNHRWGFFPSLSAAWILSEENFMKSFYWLNNLKLRFGYGYSGNQDAIDSYNSLQLVKPNGVVSSGGDPTVTMGLIRNANPDLRWEVKRTMNVGLDAAFWDGRAIFTFDYYHSVTDDMLYQYDVSVPPFAYNKLLANLGSMRNSGVELGFGFTPLRKKDMELNVNVNVTFQRNKLLSLSGMYNGEYMSAPQYTPIADLTGAGFHGYNHIVYQIVGQPLGVFYLPHCTGLIQREDGTYAYEIADLDGGGVDLEDGGDRYVAGQATPKTLLGSNISFRYKNVDVSLQINGAFGHKIYNGTALAYMNMGSFPDYNVMAAAPQRNIYDQTATDYWLENGNYVNFDYLTIGWNIPLKKWGKYVQHLRLSASVNNLATITAYSGLTPMINSYIVDATLGVDDKRNYPVYRSYTLGLTIQF